MVDGLTATLPEVAPPVEKPPAAVQDVAPEEFHESVEDCPWSMVEGLAESVAVGRGQVHGLFEPLLHTKEPSGLETLPPVPAHPPLLHPVHDELTYASPFGHWLQVGGLFAPFEHDVITQLLPFQLLPDAHEAVAELWSSKTALL